MKSIRDIIRRSVTEEAGGTIRVDDSHFFSVLLDSGNRKQFSAFLVLLVTALVCVAALVASLMFFINDVLLYPNSPMVNQHGSTVLGRSCNRESMLFLFNSADMWADTGISLQKGDRMKISYSGGFNSNVVSVVDSVLANVRPRHPLTTFSKTGNREERRDRTLYRGKDSCFGTLVYTISGDNGVAKSDEIHQVLQNKGRLFEWLGGSIKVPANGQLYLSVNDISLTPEVVAEYEKENKKFSDDGIVTRERFEQIKNKNLELFAIIDSTTVLLHGQLFRKHFAANPGAFFNDNLGEVVVLVEIDRKVSCLNWHISWYRWTESHFNAILDGTCTWPVKILLSVLFFIAAIIWLVAWKLWWLTWPLVVITLWPHYMPHFKEYLDKLRTELEKKKKKNENEDK